MNQPTILFFQGGGEGAHKADEKLARYLQHAIGNSFRILYPKMPAEDNPDFETWRPTFDEQFQKIKSPVVLVAHSVGGTLLLQYLLTVKPQNNITGIFLISVPFFGDQGWDYDGFTLGDDFGSSLPRVPVFLYHSDDDEMVPFTHLHLYAAKIPQATVRPIKGRGHQLKNDLAEIVEDIKRLS